MSKFTHMSRKEIDEYLDTLDIELRTCNNQRVKEIGDEITAANNAVQEGDFDRARDADYRSRKDQRGGGYVPRGFNPMETYFYDDNSEPPVQLRKLGSFTLNQGLNETSQMIEKSDIFSTPEYRSAFYKTLLGQDLNNTENDAYLRAMNIAKMERRSDAFSTTTNAAAVLPTTTLEQIIVKARQLGGLFTVSRGFNIPTNLSVPIATPTGKAAWHTEGSVMETLDGAAGITKVSFAAYEILKIFSLSVAAKTMSIAAFENYIVDELTASIMQTIADSLVNGTGETQGTGILAGITWDTSNSIAWSKANGLGFDDLTAAVAKLKRGYGMGAQWAMSNATLYNNIYNLKDSVGRPLFISDPKVDDIGFILGKPVILDDFIADDIIMMGNFQYMGYNMPQGILVEMSRESSFKSAAIDYRALAVADTKPLVPEAFIKLYKSAA